MWFCCKFGAQIENFNIKNVTSWWLLISMVSLLFLIKIFSPHLLLSLSLSSHHLFSSSLRNQQRHMVAENGEAQGEAAATTRPDSPSPTPARRPAAAAPTPSTTPAMSSSSSPNSSSPSSLVCDRDDFYFFNIFLNK